MRYSTTILVVALSAGQSLAGPAHAHMHKHRDVHAKKDVVDWKDLDWTDMGIDWEAAWSRGQSKTASTVAPVAVATSVTPAAVAAPAKTTAASVPTTSSSSDVVGDVTVSLWKGLKGLANSFTAFGTAAIGTGSEVAAIGNIGSPQGSNMIKVDSIEGYPFTNTFINTQKVPITVVLWNKAYAPDGTLATADPNLGSCVAPVTPTLTFALAAGAKQAVAFQDGTLMSFSQAVDKTVFSGAFDTTWGECSFKSAANGASGYDVSAILNSAGNTYWMQMSAEETTCVSDPTQNYWTAKDGNPETPIPIGTSDGSCYVPGNKATLTTKLGGNF